MKKTTHGGTRKNSGRKARFDKPTTITFKAETADIEAAKEKYPRYKDGKDNADSLNNKFLTWLKKLIK